MRSLILGPLLACALSGVAQDTITVSTLTFDSITTRRGTWTFPDADHHFRKVLMLHTLKCDPSTTQDQYACGEWDYLTYHFIHEHTGEMDSLELTHPFYRINTTAPDSTALMALPLYDRYQRYSPIRVVDAELGETDHLLGAGDATDALTLDAGSGAARTQFLLASDELDAASVTRIDALRLLVTAPGAPIGRLVVRLKNTTATTLTGLDDTGLTTVFDHAVELSTGVNTLTLLQPFEWAGAGHGILVDIAVDGATGAAPVLSGTTAQAATAMRAEREGHLHIRDGQVAVDASAFAALNDQVTILFRAYGDASLPQQTSVLEGVDAQGQRVLNIHLPWSDGRIYWDAGNSGGAYDRIDKAATTAEQEGQWNHWAFVKNTTTGQMKIYRNGVLWHSGTGKTKPLAGIVRFVIGSAANGGIPYPGAIDDVNVFATELDQPTIQAWMDRAIDATHPQYAALLYGLPFDDAATSFTPTNVAANGAGAWQLGRIAHVMTPAAQLRHARAVTVRPDLVLVAGDYESHLDSALVSEPVIHEGVALETFQVSGNTVVPLDTLYGWEGGREMTYGPDGAAVDSTLTAGAYLQNGGLSYFGAPFEEVIDHEIGRYITPYGIGLSLGTNGFTWAYDVTDYAYLLHDSVELSAGNQQELIDLRFLMIEGTPPREVVNVQRPWGPMASYSYAALSNNTALPPVTVPLSPEATQWVMRTRLTGHGHESNTGNYPHCCEWKDNTHSLYVDGQQAGSWHIWQTNDCALNPVYPQGGTWLGSREGWCPGDLVKDHDVDLTPFVSGGEAEVDYRITPVPANNQGMGNGNYVVNMDLFEFSAPTHGLDAEIDDVKRPSDSGYRSRENPICKDPVVTLRNAGAQDLTSTTFTYGVSGGTPQTYTWTGLLKHMERADVTLPVPGGDFWTGDDAHRFHVAVSAPNGGVDQYADNDAYTTHFEPPVMQTGHFIVQYKTNNRPEENTMRILDIQGNVVRERTDHAANTIYRDTLDLPPGCYTLEVTDNGNDGLSYWADPDAGSGYFRFRTIGGTTLKNFEPEFGRSIHYAFSTSNSTGIDEVASTFGLTAAPNPSDGRFSLHAAGVEGPLDLTVLDASGRLVRALRVNIHGDAPVLLDLSGEADGLYLVRLSGEGRTGGLRVVKR